MSFSGSDPNVDFCLRQKPQPRDAEPSGVGSQERLSFLLKPHDFRVIWVFRHGGLLCFNRRLDGRWVGLATGGSDRGGQEECARDEEFHREA